MPYKFKVAITTDLGSCVDESFSANSAQQISDNMPDGVTIYETTLIRAMQGDPVTDEEVFLDLQSIVSNIEYASTMTPEKVAAEHAETRRALSRLTVRFR